MLLCDAVFTENVIATAYAAQYNTCIVRLAACTQTEKFDEIRTVIQKRADEKVVVGWIGSDSTINAIYSIAPQLERLSAKFPQVELRLLINGKITLDERLRNIRYSTLTNYSEADMVREALTMDIGIFPSPSDLRDYEIRGALKAMIYMSAGVPAVCLNAGDAARIISDGENGMLVDHPDEWVSKIEALILNPALRESMGVKALGYIRTDHSLAAVGSALSRGLQTVLAQSNELKSGFSIFRKLQILFRSFVDN
jgi:glycosyltransferase involved in cell wall biosynthesis